MSSATKTLELLEYFAPTRPEIGLSQLCRLASRDKATTYRGLRSLEQTGFVEQNPVTKRYRLGPALLQLAQTREITVPRKSGAIAPLQTLSQTTGETCHASILSGTTLYKLVSVESPRHSIRVIIDVQTFPLHATASGLCALAFGPDNLIDTAKSALTTYTENTVATEDALLDIIHTARNTGFGFADGSLESDVHSLAAPLYDQTGSFAGAVSVATVASRFTPELKQQIKAQLVTASREISRNWGGTIPAVIEQSWSAVLT